MKTSCLLEEKEEEEEEEGSAEILTILGGHEHDDGLTPSIVVFEQGKVALVLWLYLPICMSMW